MAQTGDFAPIGSGAAEPANWLAALRVYLVTVMVGNFLWEGAQLPLYTIWTTGTLAEKAFAIVHCTGGDLLIGISTLVIALVVTGDRDWPARRLLPVIAVTVTAGVGYTMFSEWLNIVMRKSWAYSDLMPVVRVFAFDTGVAPLLQWIVVPLLAFCLAWRSGRSSGQEPS